MCQGGKSGLGGTGPQRARPIEVGQATVVEVAGGAWVERDRHHGLALPDLPLATRAERSIV